MISSLVAPSRPCVRLRVLHYGAWFSPIGADAIYMVVDPGHALIKQIEAVQLRGSAIGTRCAFDGEIGVIPFKANVTLEYANE